LAVPRQRVSVTGHDRELAKDFLKMLAVRQEAKKKGGA